MVQLVSQSVRSVKAKPSGYTVTAPAHTTSPVLWTKTTSPDITTGTVPGGGKPGSRFLVTAAGLRCRPQRSRPARRLEDRDRVHAGRPGRPGRTGHEHAEFHPPRWRQRRYPPPALCPERRGRLVDHRISARESQQRLSGP